MATEQRRALAASRMRASAASLTASVTDTDIGPLGGSARLVLAAQMMS
jgi:hypothetical protein